MQVTNFPRLLFLVLYLIWIIQKAKKNKNEPLHHHIAGLYSKGKIINITRNSNRTTKDGRCTGQPSRHAEMGCLDFTKKIPKNSTMVVVRVTFDKSGKPKLLNSAPCAVCTSELRKVGIKKIAWSNSNGQIVVSRLRDYHTEHLSFYQQSLL